MAARSTRLVGFWGSPPPPRPLSGERLPAAVVGSDAGAALEWPSTDLCSGATSTTTSMVSAEDAAELAAEAGAGDEDAQLWNALITHGVGHFAERALAAKLEQSAQRGIPPARRVVVWHMCAGSIDLRLRFARDVFPRLLATPCDERKAIERDLRRTFPGLIPPSRGASEGLVRSLGHVLRAYAVYDSSTGFCQGMNYVAAVCLLHSPDEESAFWLFVQLLHVHGLRELYASSGAALGALLARFDVALRRRSARVAAHLSARGVGASMFAAQWFTTLFSYQFPLSFCERVWDVIFVCGGTEAARCAGGSSGEQPDRRVAPSAPPVQPHTSTAPRTPPSARHADGAPEAAIPPLSPPLLLKSESPVPAACAPPPPPPAPGAPPPPSQLPSPRARLSTLASRLGLARAPREPDSPTALRAPALVTTPVAPAVAAAAAAEAPVAPADAPTRARAMSAAASLSSPPCVARTAAPSPSPAPDSTNGGRPAVTRQSRVEERTLSLLVHQAVALVLSVEAELLRCDFEALLLLLKQLPERQRAAYR
ncbi:hypothetical protein KFE25_004333 [Diacronema lutheri]|uniref:Rab-GAP TBC domain-containing protein n=1 Tax=Diacronema lutheri TaxID=2081491 RepID=A0A8J5XCX0_DIALT|nr:hypothetical protein KFE25_004333 [Diacronema lutheri]